MVEAADTRPPPRGRRGYWVPGIIALVALLAIGLAAGAGDLDHAAPSVLEGSDVATQIALAVEVQQHRSSQPAVSCPSQEPVRAGLGFQCTIVLGAATYPIRVVEVDGRGRVQWQIGSVPVESGHGQGS